MRVAIVRTSNGALDPIKYNVQEIGLATSLLKKGISVDIYSQFKEVNQIKILKEIDGNELKLIPLKGFAYKEITFYPSLIKQLKHGNYDLVQVHEGTQLMNPFIISNTKKVGMKTILYQGMYKDYSGISKIYQYLFDLILKNRLRNNLDYIFAKTSSAKKYIETKLTLNGYILPVGLDFVSNEEVFNELEKVLELKRKFSHLFLYIGTIEDRRDLFFLLKEIKKMCQGKGSYGLIIVGEGPNIPNVKKQVSELGLFDNVLFLGTVPNNQLGSIYENCDLFLLPSHYEIYGMVVLEALYYGLPVVSSNTAGPKDIIKEDYLGVILKMEKDNWFKGINNYLKYLNNKAEDKEKFKTKRRNYIIENYNWDRITEKYLKYIQK